MEAIEEMLAFVRARADEHRDEELQRLLDGVDLADEHDRDVVRFASYRWSDHPDYPAIN